MTTDQLFHEYKGQSIPSFDGDPANNGQCEQWYLLCRTRVDGLGVVSGNAIDRWYNQEPDNYTYIPFKTGVYPRKDDYVVWGTGVGSKAGHVDRCAADGNSSGFLGYDSNWEDIPTLRTIQHNYAFGILGYIRRRISMVQEQDVKNLIPAALNRQANDGDIKAGVGKSWQDYCYELAEAVKEDRTANPPNAAQAKLDQIRAILA